MTAPAPALSDLHARLWELQRQERTGEAADLLLSSLPLAVPLEEGDERWLWRQLLELAFQWALERQGPEAAAALIQTQQQSGGLPAESDELAAAATALQREGQPRAALLALLQQQALQAEAVPPALTLQLARLLAGEGWLEAAEATLAPLLASNPAGPDAVEAWQLGGLIAYRSHRPALCAARFQTCLTLDPAHALAPLFLAKLELDAGQLDAAAGRLAPLARRPAAAPQQEAQLHQLLWQHGLQSAQGTLAALLDLPALLADPLQGDPAGLVRWAPVQLAGSAAASQLHEALALPQQRLAATGPALPPPWWEQDEDAMNETGGTGAGGSEAPLKLALIGHERAGVSLPFGPAEAISAALADHGVEAHWFDPTSFGSTRAGVETLRAGRFDAVLDLVGWGPGQRQDLLRARVAPLQLAWPGDGLGFAAPWLDAVLLDRFLAPAAGMLPEAQLVSPGSAFCRADLPSDPAPPRQAGDGLVLGVVAPPGRLGRHTLPLWAELLEALPQARLLCVGPGYGQACVQTNLRAGLGCLGVAAERITFLPLTPEQQVPAVLVPLLAERLDLCLDPLPAGDPLAALLCLWAGVPVVCGGGEALHQRLTAGLLEQLGMGGFVAADGEAYVAIAAALAEDQALRHELRDQLRPQLAGSLVANPAQFGADLAQALRTAQRELLAARTAAALPAPWDQELDAAELERLLQGEPPA
jgi:hypothetical protein